MTIKTLNAGGYEGENRTPLSKPKAGPKGQLVNRPVRGIEVNKHDREELEHVAVLGYN